MLSIRAFARAAPRTASRIASYTTKFAFRPISHTPIRTQIVTPRNLRCFTTSRPCFDDAAIELAAKLNQEIQLESEENSIPADSDSNIQSFLSQNDQWTLEDKEGEQEMLLRRKYEDEDITVSFSIVDFNTPPMMEDESDEALMDEEDELDTPQSGGANSKGAINQGRMGGGNFKVASEDRIAASDREELRDDEDGEDGDGQPAFPANVNVLIQRANKGALRVNLVADNGVFSILSVTHLPATTSPAKGAAPPTPSELLRQAPESLYTGPPFQQLDEEVQSLLEQYLDVRGINTALALFIPEYIDVKEQREYLGWLGRVKEFVE